MIVQDDSFDATASVTVCAITTDATEAPLFRLAVAPSERNGLRQDSRLMVDKITTLPKSKLGAWIGLLVTMLNMLPIGQLDGGHVAYALLGRSADYLAYATIAICVVLGLLIPENYTLLFLPLLALLFGPRHPPPLNDITRLDRRHVALAIVELCVIVLLFMPAPLMLVTP